MLTEKRQALVVRGQKPGVLGKPDFPLWRSVCLRNSSMAVRVGHTEEGNLLHRNSEYEWKESYGEDLLVEVRSACLWCRSGRNNRSYIFCIVDLVIPYESFDIPVIIRNLYIVTTRTIYYITEQRLAHGSRGRKERQVLLIFYLCGLYHLLFPRKPYL
jgi:hypothetical protein